MSQPLPIKISDDLAVSIGSASVQLTPSMALDIAEDLARKGFRRALSEEAEDVGAIAPSPHPRG